jgi:hypothetical protein
MCRLECVTIERLPINRILSNTEAHFHRKVGFSIHFAFGNVKPARRLFDCKPGH